MMGFCRFGPHTFSKQSAASGRPNRRCSNRCSSQNDSGHRNSSTETHKEDSTPGHAVSLSRMLQPARPGSRELKFAAQLTSAALFLVLGSVSTVRAASFNDFAPLPTTTIDPDRGFEAKLLFRDRGGDFNADGAIASGSGGCDVVGGFNAAFTGTSRYRGNLIRIIQSNVILREIKMQLNFTGSADLYVSIHRRNLDGTFSRFPTGAQDFLIPAAVGTGSAAFYSTGLINGGAGLALPPGFDYAVAFAWGPTSITFGHDGLTYPQTNDNGSVLGSVALNLGGLDPPQPPVSDNLPAFQVFTGGAYSMQLCFVPQPGACCSGGACTNKLASLCTGAGSYFHGQHTICAETPCAFGACCSDDCGGCADGFTPQACSLAGGSAHWPGATCPNPSTGLCPSLTGACCNGVTCSEKCEAECLSAGGVYRGDGTDCTPNVCQGACCVQGGCLNRTQTACTGLQGAYRGDGTLCSTLPTEQQCGGACCYGFTGLDFCEDVSSRALCTYDPNGFPLMAYKGDGTTCLGATCGLIGQYGGCCLPDGTCMNTTQSVCTASWVQGVFSAGVRCESAPQTCPNLVNRCCFGNGTCDLLTGVACSARGGTSVAGQTTCSPTACASSGGACCGLATGDCTMSTQAQCELQGGKYRGDTSTCASPTTTCPGFGACCRSNGDCFDRLSAADCSLIAGTFEGAGSSCLSPSVDCDLRGACCAATGQCLLADETACDEVGGTFQGVGIACGANTCVSGACCLGTTCVQRTGGACDAEAGVYQGNDTICESETCAPRGGCCLDEECTIETQSACETILGTYLGDDTECLLDACVSGACCEASGACSEGALSGACAANGQLFHAGMLCANVECVASGACCVGVECETLTEAECGNASGVYQGDGVPCEANTCAPSCTTIVGASVPPNCAIDARQPYPPSTPGSPQGWNAITLTIDCDDTSSLSVGDFAVTTTPAGNTPGIASLAPNGASLMVQFADPIPPGSWTCVEFVPSGAKRCLGFLPGDVNSDRTTAPVDILELIDHLNGVRVPPLGLSQADIDRSNLIAPADILSEIDLLNGASGFLPWNGKNIPVCPSAAP